MGWQIFFENGLNYSPNSQEPARAREDFRAGSLKINLQKQINDTKVSFKARDESAKMGAPRFNKWTWLFDNQNTDFSLVIFLRHLILQARNYSRRAPAKLNK